MRSQWKYRFTRLLPAIMAVMLLPLPAVGVDVITNGTFDTDLSDWLNYTNPTRSDGTRVWDNSVFGNAQGSVRHRTLTGARQEWQAADSIYIPTVIDQNASPINLSFYWFKTAVTNIADRAELSVSLILPDGSEQEVWSQNLKPLADQVLDSNVVDLDVSGFCTQTGNYYLKLSTWLKSHRDGGYVQANFDDFVLDVPAAVNNAPTVVAGATAVSKDSVNRVGSDVVTLSTAFSDADVPGPGAFIVTYKVRQKDDITELTLVDALTNGNGGLTVTDQGGGNYTASYTWDPGPAQDTGFYDLYFEVSDGTDNVIDGYGDNTDELTVVDVPPNNPPTVVAGATSVAPDSVNRYGTDSTIISATFSDADDPGEGAFWVTFKVQEPDNITELTLVNNQQNGVGGLTITANGGGSYTASYTYNPDDAQNLGDYDLYFEVSDGTDNAIDGYAGNDNELTIYQQVAPTVVAGATAVSKDSVNRVGSDVVTLSATFTDVDQPGVDSFTITFKVLEPDNLTEIILVNALTNGNGGLTVTDQGGGNYTASYTWDPGPAQDTGFYDLYFEISDGTDNVIDGYGDNTDELTVVDVPPNNPPTVVAGATSVAPDSVNRYGTDSTIISATFSDADDPGEGAFWVTFKIQEPDNITELTLVNNQQNGAGGLTITANGGGSYTASYTWDPGPAQDTGLYDLYFEVSDGTDNAIDGYAGNDNELTIYQQVAPTVVAGATAVSKDSVNRVGSDVVTLSAAFTDIDQPGPGAFTVTFKVQEPDNSTEVILVDAQTSGNGGLTITDGGGGNYTAEYTWDPDVAQTAGLYDLYFEVSDGTDNAIDGYGNNGDELTVYDAVPNNPPTVVAGATSVAPDSVNRYGTDSTIISATFSDADDPGEGAFWVTFKIQEPDNITELTLVNNQQNGAGGLTITANGGGSYTASYTWDPEPAQDTGLYDLYFEVSDGADNAVDGYAGNLDELTVNEVLPPLAPVVSTGATQVSPGQVDRQNANTTTISTNFTDANQPAEGSFTITFKIREPDDATELVLVNNLTDGNGGLTVTNNGGGSYTASYTYDPSDTQTLGFHDLYFSVDDGTGTGTVVDDYDGNLNELEIIEIIVNDPPAIVAGTTSVTPSSIDRFGGATTTFSADFSDTDQPGIGGFWITFKASGPFAQVVYTVADSLQNGQSGMVITDNGGGSYTASIAWDAPNDAIAGYYSLYCAVTDIASQAVDDYANNNAELLITTGGENGKPVVQTDATFATPAGIERIGANPTTIAATFMDSDQPGPAAFAVTFKLREPGDTTEIVLASDVGDGVGGVSISDDGGGIYTASVTWDPSDTQDTGYYDLYFHVTDGADTSYDNYQNNFDELQVYDAVTNRIPTLTAGATFALPDTVNRIGSGFTMIASTFTDLDMPGRGTFTVTFKVRDQSLTEYTLIDSARHGEQGLRVEHQGGGVYQAAFQWDPDVAQALGSYDLYFYVEDGEAASAVDDYSSNPDELEVESAALLGDGHLLKRTNSAATCGGPNDACHNLVDHQAQDCLVCHTPHGTSNIYLVRDSIQTPSSGKRQVIFKTLGIGDPYNPEPTPGDPTSGVMADSTDGVFTGVCEVCHTTTGHHRNDGSHPPPAHHDAESCIGCHPHADGFANTGGGESSGGDGCGCHSSIASPMKGGTGSYHHNILSENADYTVSSRTCLMCHVHHDIFRPDLNVGFGQRAKNLRVDITTPVVQGDAGVLTNTDYQSSGTGGICLSCHTSAQTKGYTPPDGSTQTRALSKADFDAATSTHNYTVQSTFSKDTSYFNGNCVKCHNDTMTKSYQEAGAQFGTHDNPYGRLLNPLAAAAPSDPLEEKVCFSCHSTTTNPNAGSNADYYNVKTMSSTALRIEDAFNKTYAHPTLTYSGRHSADETGLQLDSINRHAECGDCHDVHAALQGTHDGSSSLVSNALKGVWGVEPTGYPNPAAVPLDNANVFDLPASYTRLDPAQKEYQICLKCHSNYTDLPNGKRNIAEEISPFYESTHGITIANQNPYCNTSTMNEPWASSGLTYCSDCHRSDDPADPEGPHGSNQEHLLVATIVSDGTNGTPLCLVCHRSDTYWSSGCRDCPDSSKYPDHPASQSAHQLAPGCFSCHMWDHSSTAGLGVPTADWPGGSSSTTPSPPPIKIWVHGQNKKWVYNEQDGSAGTQQAVDAFVNGYIANLNHSTNNCWTETCKVHSNKAF